MYIWIQYRIFSCKVILHQLSNIYVSILENHDLLHRLYVYLWRLSEKNCELQIVLCNCYDICNCFSGLAPYITALEAAYNSITSFDVSRADFWAKCGTTAAVEGRRRSGSC